MQPVQQQSEDNIDFLQNLPLAVVETTTANGHIFMRVRGDKNDQISVL